MTIPRGAESAGEQALEFFNNFGGCSLRVVNFAAQEPFLNFDGIGIQEIIGNIRNLVFFDRAFLFAVAHGAQVKLRIPPFGYNPRIGL